MAKPDYIAVSGGFDPIHIGHVRMINDAAKYGRVVVILNTDAWLRRKKGKPFMPFEERKEILENLKNVYEVVEAADYDNTVTSNLCFGTFKYFGNGGDRVASNTPEEQVCKKMGIITLYGLGGNKIQSSSQLINDFMGMEC